VITGGSQGLGKALAGILRKEAKKISLWARGESLLKQAVQELSSPKYAAIDYDTVDVTEYSQVDKAAESIDDVPDIVFCCAGT
jgi:3-dehydrosphinganine reductase